jgi:hypothetical protein
MSQLNVDNIRNRTGSNGGPNFPSGITVAVGQTAYIHGNLQVDGTETIINTETLNVSDKTVGIGSTSNASNTTADGAGIEVFASSSQTGNNKTLTWGNTSNSWEFGPNDVGLKVGTGVTVYGGTGIVSATSFKGDGSLLTGIDATAIQTGNTSVQTVDTGSDGHVKMTTEGSERVRIGPAGQIGLGGANYGTSGQLLTSAGSGSAPTWTTVSSAPEYAGIASGSIGSGNAVMVHHDGKLGKIEESFTALGSIGGLGTELGQFPNTNNQVSKVKCCQMGPSKVLIAYKNETQGTTMILRMATLSGGSWTISSSPYQIASFGAWWDCEYDPVNERAVVALTNDANETYVINVYDNGSGAITSSASAYFTGNSAPIIHLSYDTTANKFILFCGSDSDVSNYATVRTLTTSSTASSFTFGTKVTVHSSAAVNNTLAAYDSVNNKTLLVYKATVDNSLRARVATVSGSDITLGTESTISTSNWNGGVLEFDTNAGKFFNMVFRGGAALDSRVLTISGTTVSAGTVNSSMTSNVNGIQSHQDIWAQYDIGLKNFVVGYRNNYVGKFRQVTINGTSLTLGSEQNSEGGNSVDDQDATYMTDTNRVFFAYQDGSNNYGHYQYWQTSSVTTNVTTENFLGFSKAAYTDGQTATIEVSGATNDNQSSLTPGQNYFVQNNGSLGVAAATPKVYAGTAVSATKLLVGKESAPASAAVEILASADLGSDYGQNYFDYTGITNDSGYIRYAMLFSGVQFVDGSSQTFGFRFYRGSSGTLETGSIYECTTAKKSYGYNSITNESNSPGNAFILLGNSNNSRQLWSGKLEWANVFNPSTKNAPPVARCLVDQGGNSWHSIGWDACRFTTTNTEWISGVRLMNYGSGSNLKNGRITVYGYRY